MVKKCIICEENPAKYRIKDTNDVYCKECAEGHFADLSYLENMVEHDVAKKIQDKAELLLKHRNDNLEIDTVSE